MADTLTVTAKGAAWHWFRRGLFRKFEGQPVEIRNAADDAWTAGWTAGFAAGRASSDSGAS